jgi:hypothetical protein
MLPVKHLLGNVPILAGLDDKAIKILLEHAERIVVLAGGVIAREASTAKTLWIPAVNNAGEFGRGAFLEIRDPWVAQKESLAFLEDGGGK